MIFFTISVDKHNFQISMPLYLGNVYECYEQKSLCFIFFKKSQKFPFESFDNNQRFLFQHVYPQ